jgi:hypothetical protein
MKELELMADYPFKNILKHIVDNYKNDSEYSYEFSGYNFSTNLVLTPSIRIINSELNKKNTFVYINCLLYIQDIYRDFEDIDDCETDFVNLLHCHDIDFIKNPSEPCVFKIAKAIDFINNLKYNYIYSKYHDLLINKKKYKKKILIDREEAIICKREIHECIVCYENVSSQLKTVCCGQYICRLCVNQICPLKCPNCRTEFFVE